MASQVDIDLEIKRISKKPTSRVNPNDNNSKPITDVKEYYRITVFISYIDYFISQLTDFYHILKYSMVIL